MVDRQKQRWLIDRNNERQIKAKIDINLNGFIEEDGRQRVKDRFEYDN